MCKYLMIAVVALSFAGCKSATWARVTRYEQELAGLEENLVKVKQFNLDPTLVKIPPNFNRKIEKLKVFRPYGAIILALCPGIAIPGLGSFSVGDTQRGEQNLLQAAGGIVKVSAGLIVMSIALGLEEDEEEDKTQTTHTLQDMPPHLLYEEMNQEDNDEEDEKDIEDRLFQYGLELFIQGVTDYFSAWVNDFAATYTANDYLALRVRLLRHDARKFLLEYLAYRRQYNLKQNQY